MPTFTYMCNSCNKIFEKQLSFKEYDTISVLCECGSNDLQRDSQADVATVVESHKTVGSLANKNTSRMSDDEKESINRKNNAYLNKEFTGKLPEGAKTFEKKNGKRVL